MKRVLKILSTVAGPAAFAAILACCDLAPGKPEVTRMAAVAAWIAIWWMTEAIPIPATSLLPLILLPALGLRSTDDVARSYGDDVLFLFLAGFLIALAMQRWNLHRRLALRIVLALGRHPVRLIGGVMAATAFLSMWISNTATTLMLLPIILGLVERAEGTMDARTSRRFAVSFLLALCYSASIGGIATPVGTPPNLIFAGQYAAMYPNGPAIDFAEWMYTCLPLVVVFLGVTWLFLVGWMLRPGHRVSLGDPTAVRDELRDMGPLSSEERYVLAVFATTTLLWIFRKPIELGIVTVPGWSAVIPDPAWRGMINDATVGLAMALVLFLIPSKREPGTRLLDWSVGPRIPWGILLLFGGGFALADAIRATGLSETIVGSLGGLEGAPIPTAVMTVGATVTFLTEITSNAATTQVLLPLLGPVANLLDLDPRVLMIAATLSASCAFMLPVATPPNAIVFGSERVTIGEMARRGIVLNLVGVVLIYLTVRYVAPVTLGLAFHGTPAWAR